MNAGIIGIQHALSAQSLHSKVLSAFKLDVHTMRAQHAGYLSVAFVDYTQLSSALAASTISTPIAGAQGQLKLPGIITGVRLSVNICFFQLNSSDFSMETTWQSQLLLDPAFSSSGTKHLPRKGF